jgi:hypothetical protein
LLISVRSMVLVIVGRPLLRVLVCIDTPRLDGTGCFVAWVALSWVPAGSRCDFGTFDT